MNFKNHQKSSLSALKLESVPRINEYLELGGLFNPEMMDHSKVSELLIDIRDGLLDL